MALCDYEEMTATEKEDLAYKRGKQDGYMEGMKVANKIMLDLLKLKKELADKAKGQT